MCIRDSINAEYGVVCRTWGEPRGTVGMEDIMLSRQKSEAKLPKSTLTALIKDILPSDLKMPSSAKEVVVEAAMEFLQLLSSEAAEVCNKEKKSKIVPGHVVSALRELKFGQYVGPVLKVEEDCKASRAKRPKLTSRLDGSGISAEELESQQQALFAKSRAAYRVSLSRTNSEMTLSRDNSSLALSRNVSEATMPKAAGVMPGTPARMVPAHEGMAAPSGSPGGVMLMNPNLNPNLNAENPLKLDDQDSDDDYDNL
eukprot:TRINITY_DN9632_c0_g1_i1.p1 TRINITY_DN9632_c0_g1~~TRINITY_DN9632_c0_g1_i1.p1  ORF type:complete len:256 (+),score=69.07 TRINITY_DN9632_c0_g1_i1:137-904(+)